MAKFLTDFANGIQTTADYLDPTHHIKTSLSGSLADLSRIVEPAALDTNLKEIICGLLAGRGLKLPNIQICISMNLDKLINLPNIQTELAGPLRELATSVTAFLDHTKIDAVLGRINNVLAEATNIANMINFCSAPLDPVAIPNALEQSMQSFLGPGKDIIDKIGTMPSIEIKGCLSSGFNCNAFTGGILGILATNCDATKAGTLDISIINKLVTDAAAIKSSIETLIAAETSVTGLYDNGGSDFSNGVITQNENMGVLHNAQEAGIQGNTRIASQLKALYDSLGSYQVIHNDGTVYNNIFELFVDASLMDILRNPLNPTIPIVVKQEVYNYCGDVVGYIDATAQPQQQTSAGIMPTVLDLPGFDAAGLQTSPGNAQATATSSGNTTTVQKINDTSLLYLYAAENKGNRLNMVGGIMDPFADQTDVDTALSANEVFSTAAGSYSVANIPISVTPNNMTSNTAPTPYVITTSDNNTTIYRMFDGTTSYSLDTTINSWFTIDIGSKQAIDRYAMTPGVNATSYSYKSWTFEGSTDNVSWTLLDTQVNKTWAGVGNEIIFPCLAGSYRYFKWTLTAHGGTAGANQEMRVIAVDTNSMLLQSNAFTASAAPTNARIGIQASGIFTINTDLTAEVSRDGGTTWAMATLVMIDVLADGTTYYEDAAVQIGTQPTGTAMKYRIITHNVTTTIISGVLLQWS